MLSKSLTIRFQKNAELFGNKYVRTHYKKLSCLKKTVVRILHHSNSEEKWQK